MSPAWHDGEVLLFLDGTPLPEGSSWTFDHVRGIFTVTIEPEPVSTAYVLNAPLTKVSKPREAQWKRETKRRFR